MKLLDRTQWGAREPRNVEHIAGTQGTKVHYVGEHVGLDLVDDHAHCAAMVRSIQRHHMDDNAWADIAYSALVCPHGWVFAGRGPGVLVAANGPGLNRDHYAVCGLVGDSGLIQPSDAMLNGIRDAIEWLRDKGHAGKEIKGHRDGYSTSCPGAKLYAWVKAGAPRPGKPAPEPIAPPFAGRLLKLAKPMIHGSDVLAWQKQMRVRGWSIVADGYYGADSAEVCRKFQAEKHLGVDGIVGVRTWSAAWEATIT